MAKNLVEIIVTAEDKASSVLNGIGGALKGIGTVALAGVGVATGAVAGLTAGVISLASAAAPVEGLTASFEELTSSMEGGSTAMLAALQDSSNGLVTNTDLMRTFNTAASLVSKDFAEQLPSAMDSLSKVAAATGQDMGFMLDSLVKGVGRLSPMILDNLGIQVNLAEANEVYAKSIGKSVDELTKAEQQTALTNQVMEKLAENTAGMEGMSNPFQAFRVTLQNLRDEIGVKLLKVVGPLMEKFSELAQKIIPKLMEKVDGLVEVIAKVGDVILDFISNLEEGMSPLDAFIEAMEGIAPPGVIAALVDFRDNILPGLKTAFSTVVEAITPFVTAIIDFVSTHGPEIKQILISIGVALGALTIITTVVGWITGFIGAVTAVSGAIAAAGGGIAGIVAILGGPVTIVIAAVTALIGLLAMAWQNNWGDIQGKTAAVWEFIKPILQSIYDWIQTVVIPSLLELWQKWVNEVWPAIKQAVSDAWEFIKPILQSIADWIVNTLIPKIQELWQKWTQEVWPAIQRATDNAWKIIEEIFTEIGRWINDNLGPWIDAFKLLWVDTVWPAVKKAVSDAWNKIKPIFEKIQEWIEVTIPPILETLKPIFEGAMKGVASAVEIAKGIWDAFVGAVKDFWSWISGANFEFNISIPDLPSWATPGSPLPIHTAWKAFAADMDKIGGDLAGGFNTGLAAPLGTPAPVTSGGRTAIINIDARGASPGVEDDIRRVMDDVMREYGMMTDMRIRTA